METPAKGKDEKTEDGETSQWLAHGCESYDFKHCYTGEGWP